MIICCGSFHVFHHINLSHTSFSLLILLLIIIGYFKLSLNRIINRERDLKKGRVAHNNNWGKLGIPHKKLCVSMTRPPENGGIYSRLYYLSKKMSGNLDSCNAM